jgi:O-antigen/teichoic acid export membrane protein
MVFAKDKKSIIKDTSHYTLSNYAAQFVGIITAIVVRRGLGPALMGMWELLKVIMRYSNYFDLGVSAVAFRDIPFHLGRNDDSEALRLKNVCFSYTIAVSLLLASALIAWSFLKSGSYAREMIIGLRVIGLVLILTSVYNFFINLMRAYKNFAVLSQLVVINAVLILALAMFLVPRFKLYGMYIAISLTLVICCGYAFLMTRYTFRPSFEKEKFKYVLRTGIPILFAGAGLVLLMSVDKIVIARFLGFKELGFYTISSMAVMTLYTMPKSFGIVVFPRMQEHYGRVGDIRELGSYLVKPLKMLAYVMPLIIGVVYFAMPELVRHVLPRYTPGITAFKIMMGGVFFVCVAYPSNIFMITINKQVRLAAILFTTVLVAVLASCFSVKRGMGLEGVAFSMSLSYFVYFAALTTYTLKKVLDIKEDGAVLLAIMGSFLYFLVLALIIDNFITLSDPLAGMLLRIFLFVLAGIAFLLCVNKGDRKGYFTWTRTKSS